MMDVITNPDNMESAYLECLNRCFDDWGGIAKYMWCFRRQSNALKADIMILRENGMIVAGSAVTYRRVSLANGSMVLVGVMTGSWTLPSARHHGCFGKIIEASLALASNRSAALLLAFVTEGNASFRRLSAAGSMLFPTHYLSSGERTHMPRPDPSISPVSDIEGGVKVILERLGRSQVGLAHFVYTPTEWKSQFLNRPSTTEFVHVGDTSLAILEKTRDSDTLLCLSLGEADCVRGCVGALLERASRDRRRLLLFTTSMPWNNECIELGMERASGYLSALVADGRELARAYPAVHGLRKDTDAGFCNPDSILRMGSWDIQSGDRM